MSTAAATTRILAKLQVNIADGQYYEAHQTYRTLYSRYSASSQFDRCLTLLAEGVKQFLAAKQMNSAVDLAELMVDTLNKEKRRVEDTDLDMFTTILNELPPAPTKCKKTCNGVVEGTDDAMATDEATAKAGTAICMDRGRVCAALIAWSKCVAQDGVDKKRGHPLVHEMLADVYFKTIEVAGCWHTVRHHYMHSQNAKKCATFLIAYQTKRGKPDEVDLFPLQFVAQMLCFKYTSGAQEVLSTYAAQHAAIKSSLPIADGAHPLLNFAHFLCAAVDEKKPIDVYAVLVEKYMPQIEAADASLKPYLDKIGQLYFGMPPPQKSANGLQGILGNLLKGLMGGQDDEEMEEEEPAANTTNGKTAAKPSQMMEDDGLD